VWGKANESPWEGPKPNLIKIMKEGRRGGKTSKIPALGDARKESKYEAEKGANMFKQTLQNIIQKTHTTTYGQRKRFQRILEWQRKN